MENITNTSDVTFFFSTKLWTGNIVISSILIFVTVYIAAALIYHEVNLAHSKHKNFSQLSSEKKFAVMSKYICILIAIISVIRNVNSVALLAAEKTAIFSDISVLDIDAVRIACKILPRIGISALTLGTGLVYLFLWFRQRVFYIHPSINVLNNKLVRATSWGIILLWFLYYVSTILCYYFLVEYQFNEDGGCLVVGHTTLTYFNILVFWTAVSVLMQIALLGLFIFPIIKRTLWKSQNANRHTILLRRVKKAIIITATCLISDVLSAGITWSVTRPNVNSFFVIYSLNLVINHLATVVCFDHWKLMLWPWKYNRINKANYLNKSSTIHSGYQDYKNKITTAQTLDKI